MILNKQFPGVTIVRYLDGALVEGLWGGINGSTPVIEWSTVYRGMWGWRDFQAYDDLESYTNAATVSGLNGGTNMLGAWTGQYGGAWGWRDFQALDDFEAYTDTNPVNGLNLGTNVLGSWSSMYVGATGTLVP